MSEAIRYVSTNSNLTFDFSYQKASLELLLQVLRRNDKTSSKLKEELIEKAKNTLGLNRLPESDRVTPFFHCQEGKFHISFLFDSSGNAATPWDTIIAHNFRELIPLFHEIYDLLKRPIFDSSSATIGNYSVFHHQNAITYHTKNNGIAPAHQYIEYNSGQKDDETDEELSVYELEDGSQIRQPNRMIARKDEHLTNNNRLMIVNKSPTKPLADHRYYPYNNGGKYASEETTGEESSVYEHNQQIRRSTRQSAKKDNTINGRVVTIKKSTTTTKKGKKNLVTKSIEMSSSMPNLNNTMNSTGSLSHRYSTRFNNKNEAKSLLYHR